MSDAAAPDPSGRPATAGGLLRAARQAQGLHIAALAAAIKVAQRKLELLETDQFDQLPDATFTRALAQTVCRSLKIDPAPILALLPPARGARLEQVAEGLNMPFRERPGQLTQKDGPSVAMPVLLIAAVLLIGAAAMYLVPGEWLHWPKSIGPKTADSTAAAPAAPAASSAATEAAAMPAPEPAASVAAAPTPSATAAPNPPTTSAPGAVDESTPIAANGVLKLRPTESSWIEVIDAHGKPLISRLVQPGESIGLDGAMPLKVKIGNAFATQVVFRDQPLDLGPFTRDNMAKLELK